MKWLTQKEIKAAGKKSKRAAVACAKKHWKQLATATEDELKNGLKRKRVSIYFEHCSLCSRYICTDCPFSPCPFSPTEKRCCPDVYFNAQSVFYNWDAEDCPHSAFQESAQKVYEALCKL